MKLYYIDAYIRDAVRFKPMMQGDLIEANSHSQAIAIFYERHKIPFNPTNEHWAQVVTVFEVKYVEPPINVQNNG